MTRKKVKRRSNKKGIIVVSLIVLVFCGFVLINSIQLKQKIDSYAAEEAELQAQIDDQISYQEDLVRESEYMNSYEYIEAIAREKLGLLKDNEIILKKQEN